MTNAFNPIISEEESKEGEDFERQNQQTPPAGIIGSNSNNKL